MSILVASIALLLSVGDGGMHPDAATAASDTATADQTPSRAPTGAPLVEGRVSTGGADIWYGSVGEGTPILLLHGGRSSSRAWDRQVPALVAAGFRVILIDTRGHGRSTLGQQSLSYDLFARDVLAVMDHLRVERAHVVGWSDGGITALVLAMRAPQRFDRIYAYGANMDPQGVRADAQQAPILKEIGPRLIADYRALSPTPDGFGALHDAVRRLQANEPRYTAAALSAIEGPRVRIAAGARDEFITSEHPAYLARTIPGATLTVFPQVGHFAPWMAADRFNRDVVAFMRTPAPANRHRPGR
ncbi:pimeloyl-ACP methyl ester carboxylesterase [Sphingomonas zeicaulis]|uniref:alpha/beta fold hydrolase n=1 Tax=Sphingomonas zeicaulis TaxID=1632740 RepID=UPI003D1E1E26